MQGAVCILMSDRFPISLTVAAEDAGKRLDQFLTAHLSEVSRARIQQLIEQRQVQVNAAAAKASLRLRGGEQILVLASPKAPPLRAMPEAIPLDIVFEDADMAVVNKPAGMMVHAGAGSTEDARNRGTLVNALLHRFGSLSEVGGELRPGIVHRLDKDTSGLMVVAKNDSAHRKLATQFSRRTAKKKYIALVHGWLKQERGTVQSNISRDRVRRTRMTTRRNGGREAVTHYVVVLTLDTPYGKFSLLELEIDTGRTHQIRVHVASLGHPVVGDTLYGAPAELKRQERSARGKKRPDTEGPALTLPRNFLHSAELELQHPRTGETLTFARPLPQELQEFLRKLEGQPA
jgi:23S rRNA pseudouridine1911/1915/1917 synthase